MSPLSKLKTIINNYVDRRIEVYLDKMAHESKVCLFQSQEEAIAPEKTIHEKCILGEASVIYSPELITSQDQDKNSICIGESTHIRGELMTFPGGKIEIGNFCYVGSDTRIWLDTLIRIGDRVLISHNVNIFDSQTHPLDPVKRHNPT